MPYNRREPTCVLQVLALRHGNTMQGQSLYACRNFRLPQELHCNHLMSFPRGLVVVAAASTAASKRCGSMCPSEPSGIEFVCNLLGGCTMCDSPLAEDRVVRLVDESLSPCRDKLCSALACLQQVHDFVFALRLVFFLRTVTCSSPLRVLTFIASMGRADSRCW